jgi:hypothetical protein
MDANGDLCNEPECKPTSASASATLEDLEDDEKDENREESTKPTERS